MLDMITKASPYRKGKATLLEIVRKVRKLISTPDDYLEFPPILVNSFPKSGTHLLLQVVEAIPSYRNYGKFIASMPSVTFRERDSHKTVKLINSLVPREIACAHLFFSPLYEDVLKKLNVIHFFIYRDLRDVAVSEAFYLSEMNRWHRLHKYFKSLDSLEDKILFAIKGNEFLETPYDYPNIKERFERYKGWLYSPFVLKIKYEELVSEESKTNTIARIMKYYLHRTSKSISNEKISSLVQKAIININPKKSHTFRKGGKGNWKKFFTEKLKKAMKETAGELLIELQYEKDFDW